VSSGYHSGFLILRQLCWEMVPCFGRLVFWCFRDLEMLAN